MDRYAYVNNSPINYTDPSGHKCAEGIFAHEECEPPPPTPRPSDLSDKPGENTRISGNDFYNWYIDLWNTPGWWWTMFGKDEDGFTIFDAFAVIYVFEANGHWSEPWLGEAAIRDANDWCHDKFGGGGGSCTTGGYINHFAHEYESAGNWVRAGIPPNPFNHFSGDFPKFTGYDAQSLRNVSASFMNHPGKWDSGCTPSTAPCGWANNSESMYPPDVRQKLHNNQYALYVYTPGDDMSLNRWFIPSACVAHFWVVGAINAICDSVP